MKEKQKFFFVGARFYCAERMLEMHLNVVRFAAVENSFLANELKKRKIDYVPISSKKDLLELIRETDFDVLVSEGCPYILPVSELKKGNQLFVNLHPSLLPDLKGKSPVNGSILFDRPIGATCHLMDDGIDTGAIISQVPVCKHPDLPLDLLYQLVFMAEADAFEDAYHKNFEVSEQSQTQENYLYYSRKREDQLISREDSLELILRKVKAFQVEGQYATIELGQKSYEVQDLLCFENSYLDRYDADDYEAVLVYKNNVVTRYKNHYLLWRLNNTAGISAGDKLL